MKYAHNKKNEILEAVLLTRKIENLTCPTCRKPVELRLPRDFDNYFAHKKGVVGMDACENYHPSMGSSVSIQRNVRQNRVSANLYLQYKLYRTQPSWDLCLKIPKATLPKGEIRVPAAKYGVQSVWASELIKNVKIIPLRVGDTHYRINCIGVEDETLSLKLKEGCQGLNPDRVNIFRFSNSICRILRNDEPMFWGRRYFLVTKKNIVNTVPSFVRKEMLPTISSYNCALIEIPSYTDLDNAKRVALEDAINDMLEKELVKPLPIIELITPNIYYDEVNEIYEIDEKSELIVGVSSEDGEQITEMDISDVDGQLIQQKDIDVHSYELFQVKDKRDFYEFSLPQNPYESLLVSRAKYKVDLVKEIATVTFRKASMYETIPFSSPVLKNYLRSVIENELSLDSVDVLEKMPIHISYGAQGAQKYEQFIMCNEPDNSISKPIGKQELLSKIDGLLKGLFSFTVSIGNSVSIRFGDDDDVEQLINKNGASGKVERQSDIGKRARWLISYSNLLEGKGSIHARESEQNISAVMEKKLWPEILQSHAKVSKAKIVMKTKKGDL